MTVAYNLDISSSTWASVTKVVFRWRGSMWKNALLELLFWLALYGIISWIIRNHLNENQIESLRSVRDAVVTSLTRIPLSLLVGFFVTVVFNRWSATFNCMSFIDDIALLLSCIIQDEDNESRTFRRRIIRYTVLTQALVLRDISLRVRRRFPRIDSFVENGMMTAQELELYESQVTTNSKYWMPMQWAMKDIWATVKKHNYPDVISYQMVEKLRLFRADLGRLFCYDWVPVPLSYPQIVFVAVRSYFLITIVGRQWLPGDPFDAVIPVMTILELSLYIGYVKVAETMLNPLGVDDDDFEGNYLIDRNLSIGFEIVDLVKMPPFEKEHTKWRRHMLHLQDPESSNGNIPFQGSVADIQLSDTEFRNFYRMGDHRKFPSKNDYSVNKLETIPEKQSSKVE